MGIRDTELQKHILRACSDTIYIVVSLVYRSTVVYILLFLFCINTINCSCHCYSLKIEEKIYFGLKTVVGL
jgi:hypothetical protein